MPIIAGTLPNVASEAERREQLREILEGSGIFTWRNEGFADNIGIYDVVGIPAWRAKISNTLRGLNVNLNTAAANPTDTSYLYGATLADPTSATIKPTPHFVLTSYTTASSAATSPTAYITSIDVTVPYIYLNQPNSKYLRIGTWRILWAKSQSGRAQITVLGTTQLRPSSVKALPAQPVTGTVLQTLSPLLTAAQYTFAQDFSMNYEGKHDRMIQNLLPADYIDNIATDYISGAIINDILPDIFTFSRQASAPVTDSVYVDSVTGKKYYCILSSVDILIALYD